tara:strand:- start:420 stop:1268 length:849 start_codon:yes stop_codon:yes gene_type:complete
MKSTILTILFCIISLGLFAQTTIDEYNYASGGFKKATQLGIGPKEGYKIVPFTGLVDSYYSNTWKGEYSISLLLREESDEDSIAAVILEKGASTYCVPHPYSDALMTSRSMTDFVEFWNSYNDALMFQLIQTAVWGKTIEKKFEGKTILQAEYSVANFYEHEPTPLYAKHWGEFLHNTSGRESAYNALADYPLYECSEACSVMVKYYISEKGVVTKAEVVDDVFFKEYDGSLLGTSTDLECVLSYAVAMVQQFTYKPMYSLSKTESVGYVLIALEFSKSQGY